MADPELLFRGLFHGTLSARMACAEALGEMGDPRAPRLLCQALGEWQVGDAAARVLVRIGAPAVAAVCQALRSEDATARARAAHVLGEIGNAAAVPALGAALQDPEASVRVRVLQALAQIGDPSAVPPLVEMLRYPGWATPRAAAAALGRVGDRRAILPLWEALLDAPASLDPYFREALQAVARRHPGPELREVLRRLERELQTLDGESRRPLVAARWHLVRAAAPLKDMPIPAAAPAPSLESLPLPARPASPATEYLPLPAAPGSPDPAGQAAPRRIVAPLVPAAAGSLYAETAAPESILSRFQSVAHRAPRGWMALRPVRLGQDVVFRRWESISRADVGLRIALYIVLVVNHSLPPWLVWWLLWVLLFGAAPFRKLKLPRFLPISLGERQLSLAGRRADFKVDSAAQEIIIYPLRTRQNIPKRKRLPLDQIDYFLGRSGKASDGIGQRLVAALRDGRLEALTDDLGKHCHVQENVRILAVTCGKPAYFLDGRAPSADLLVKQANGDFTVRNRSKLMEMAKRLYPPQEEEAG